MFFPFPAPSSAELLARGPRRGLRMFWGARLGALDGGRRGPSLVRPGWVVPWAWSQRGCGQGPRQGTGPRHPCRVSLSWGEEVQRRGLVARWREEESRRRDLQHAGHPGVSISGPPAGTLRFCRIWFLLGRPAKVAVPWVGLSRLWASSPPCCIPAWPLLAPPSGPHLQPPALLHQAHPWPSGDLRGVQTREHSLMEGLGCRDPLSLRRVLAVGLFFQRESNTLTLFFRGKTPRVGVVSTGTNSRHLTAAGSNNWTQDCGWVPGILFFFFAYMCLFARVYFFPPLKPTARTALKWLIPSFFWIRALSMGSPPCLRASCNLCTH